MFCPFCGGVAYSTLFGGCCRQSCLHCNGAIDCFDPISKKEKRASQRIWNPFKALCLRVKYNLDSVKRSASRNRKAEYREFHKEVLRNTIAVNKHYKK